MRKVTVACVQMSPQLGEIEPNIDKMASLIHKVSSDQKVDLIVFPELTTTGYENGPRFPELAERVPGHTVNTLSQVAAEFQVHVAFGLVAKEKVESILYNAAVLIGPDGELLGEYRKVHPRGEERLSFRPGFRLPVIETELGMVGLMLGWDLAFPEVARSLALDGAELLAVLGSWEEPHQEEWTTLLRARALENACFVAAANRTGKEFSYTFCGNSLVAGPHGEVLASLEGGEDEHCSADMDIDEVRAVREETQMLQYRQPPVYRAVVRKY